MRLFYPFTRKRIYLHKNFFTIQKVFFWKKSDLNIGYKRTKRKVSIRNSFIFSKVEIFFDNTSTTISLPNFDKNKFLENYLLNRDNALKKHYEAKKEIINFAYNFLHQHKYLSGHRVQYWFENFNDLKNYFEFADYEYVLDKNFTLKITFLKNFFKNPEKIVIDLNNSFIARELNSYKQYFDTIESNPLTQKQRKACVVNENNDLVIAGAGSGKTSVIVAKVGYLLKSGLARPNEILVLAYNKDASLEIKERLEQKLSIKNFDAYTFHKLGKIIIESVDNEEKSVSKLANDEKLFIKTIDDFFDDLIENNSKIFNLLCEFFLEYLYPAKNETDFKNYGEYISYLKSNEIRALGSELVKSHEEVKIANFLFMNSIEYEYEKEYKYLNTYRPDFYLPEYDIYIEHFGVNEDNTTASFVNNEKYLKEMEWKRDFHKAHQTILIETYSYQFKKGTLLESLKEKLLEHNVKFIEKKEEILEKLRNFGKHKKFSKFIFKYINNLKSSGKTIETLKKDIEKLPIESYRRNFIFLEIFSSFLSKYEEYLRDSFTIDYFDMIIKANKYLSSNKYESKWKYILVDEFQDISRIRLELIKNILKQQKGRYLFCVGDDWQSIYGFAGSDINLIQPDVFSNIFGKSKLISLDKTFRYNNNVSEVSHKFIIRNKKQLNKDILTLKKTDKPTVHLAYSNDKIYNNIFDVIDKKSNGKSISLCVIYRYNYKKEDIENILSKYSHNYKNINIKYMSEHTSKGTEADYVIIIDVNKTKKGDAGFPCEIKDDPLLSLVLPPYEDFEHAEERRLFYVALTRTKNDVWITFDKDYPSDFVKELIDEEYDIHIDFENIDDIPNLKCPKCKGGYLILKTFEDRKYFECTNSPYCDYRGIKCPNCNNYTLLLDEQVCKSCHQEFEKCPVCGGVLIEREGVYSKFLGCSNYNGNSVDSCRYTRKI